MFLHQRNAYKEEVRGHKIEELLWNKITGIVDSKILTKLFVLLIKIFIILSLKLKLLLPTILYLFFIVCWTEVQRTPMRVLSSLIPTLG
jgi:hypothetical protein